MDGRGSLGVSALSDVGVGGVPGALRLFAFPVSVSVGGGVWSSSVAGRGGRWPLNNDEWIRYRRRAWPIVGLRSVKPGVYVRCVRGVRCVLACPGR